MNPFSRFLPEEARRIRRADAEIDEYVRQMSADGAPIRPDQAEIWKKEFRAGLLNARKTARPRSAA